MNIAVNRNLSNCENSPKKRFSGLHSVKVKFSYFIVKRTAGETFGQPAISIQKPTYSTSVKVLIDVKMDVFNVNYTYLCFWLLFTPFLVAPPPPPPSPRPSLQRWGGGMGSINDGCSGAVWYRPREPCGIPG